MLPANLKVNQYVYFELHSDHLPEMSEVTGAKIFHQDSVPAHNATSVVNWLSDCAVLFIRDWLGNGPNLSSTENLWYLVKDNLKEKDIILLGKLEAAIRKS